MSFGENHRTFRCAIAERLSRAVRTWAARHPSVKAAARSVATTSRTVENWISGQNAPAAKQLIALMQESDEVWRAICELTGRESVSLTRDQRRHVNEALRLLGDK